jgi:MscS family membrane protein
MIPTVVKAATANAFSFSFAKDIHLLHLPLWSWLSLVVILIFAILVAFSFVKFFEKSIAKRISRKHQELFLLLCHRLTRSTQILTSFILFSIFSTIFRSALEISDSKTFFLLHKILIILGIYNLSLSIIDFFHDFIHSDPKLKKSTTQRFELNTFPLGKNAIKLFVTVIFALIVLQNLGVDLTAVFAGIGVGGLAIAFASQKAVENLIGGLSLILDNPIKVGDNCRFENQSGTVEEIGIRSTRIRTQERTLITIPNASFAQTKIENFSRRDNIFFNKKLGLLYETTPSQIRQVVQTVTQLLKSHPMLNPETVSVRFINFGQCSLDIEVLANVQTTEWSKYLAVQEELLLKMMELILQAGTKLTLPSSSVYLGRVEKAPSES